eukprot:1183434-Prorocentrum_minimum.AAC.4
MKLGLTGLSLARWPRVTASVRPKHAAGAAAGKSRRPHAADGGAHLLVSLRHCTQPGHQPGVGDGLRRRPRRQRPMPRDAHHAGDRPITQTRLPLTSTTVPLTSTLLPLTSTTWSSTRCRGWPTPSASPPTANAAGCTSSCRPPFYYAGSGGILKSIFYSPDPQFEAGL